METGNRIDLGALSSAIMRWYDAEARELPWRGSRDPYRIWVSEIMLQQTRAQTVIPYFEAFMADWPTPSALADADEQAVLKRWEGLGYYSRARNLLRAARIIKGELGGVMPVGAKALRALPGIGEYTSGMIASIAYGECAPAIDGNQIRVLSRLFRMDKPARSREGMAALSEHALSLMPPDRPGDFNQALMDLGSSVCKPGKPDCANCPAARWCLAHATGEPELLPVLPGRVPQRIERRGVAVVVAMGCALVQRRPGKGLLGGMWTFPNYLDADSPGAVAEALAEIGIIAQHTGARVDVEHVFTHLIWLQQGYGFRATGRAQVDGMEWQSADGLRALAFPAAHRAYRELAIQMIESRDDEQ